MKNEFVSDAKKMHRNYFVTKSVEAYGSQHPMGSSSTQFSENLSVSVENDTSGSVVAKILKTNFRKNGRRSFDNPLEHYFIKSADMMSRLTFKLSTEGRIESVLNRKDIVKNWENVKVYLDRTFVSDDSEILAIIHNCTSQIEKIVNDEKLFLDAINRDWLFDRMFYGYWVDYGESGTLFQNHLCPLLLGEAKVVLMEELHVSELQEKKQILFNGNLSEQFSDMESINRYFFEKGLSMDGLSVTLVGDSLVDEAGLLEHLNTKVSVQLADASFKKEISLMVKMV